MATRGVNACRLCHELFRTSLRRNFSIQSINNHSKISRLELFKIKERGLHITPAQWQVSNNLVRRNDKNFTWLKQMKMHCSSESSTLMEDLEDIQALLPKRLSDVDESKRDQLLNIVDELIKSTLYPDEPHQYHKLVSSVDPSDLYTLATKIYSLHSSVGEEAEKLSVPLFRTSALQGDTNGKYSYGQLLFRGAGGLSPDPIEAAQMFMELAKLGHPQAQFTLAGMYYAGMGLDQDFETAYTLYQVASENGIVQSFNSLGKLYLNGEGVEKDESKAFEYFMKGAEANDAQACMSVGHCYSHGKGVEKNFEHAFFYHKKAADLGYPPGIYNVGTHYFAGKGIDIDMEKAAEYFQKAADLGFTLAEVNLGNMYYQGLGIEQDIEKARQLYKRAAPKHRNARLLLEELEQEEEEKAKAKKDSGRNDENED